jgi:predicted nucleic acid-binding protein
MNVLFDTSVVIAALSARHLAHASALAWLQRVKTGHVSGYLSTHGLAECYSVMTGHPRWRIPPNLFVTVMNETLSLFKLVELEPDDYHAAITRMAALKLPGGGSYDALHAQAA